MQQLKSSAGLTWNCSTTDLTHKYAPTVRQVKEVEQQIDQVKTAIAAQEKAPVQGETTQRRIRLLRAGPRSSWSKARAEARLTESACPRPITKKSAAAYHSPRLNAIKNSWSSRNLLRQREIRPNRTTSCI
jgi:hypothetical protein